MLPFEYVDSNIFIRYITLDEPLMAQRARAFFLKLDQGSAVAATTEAVLLEVVQVLSSRKLYNLSRSDIRQYLAPLIRLPGLRIPFKTLYLDALDLYATSSLDFTDALLVILTQRGGTNIVVSFDQDFDKVPGVARQAP